MCASPGRHAYLSLDILVKSEPLQAKILSLIYHGWREERREEERGREGERRVKRRGKERREERRGGEKGRERRGGEKGREERRWGEKGREERRGETAVILVPIEW